MKSNCHRAFGAAAAFFLGFGASAALADGYYVGSVKDAAPVPAPVAYEWNGFSVGAGIGIANFQQDVSGWAEREDVLSKCKKHKNFGLRGLFWKCKDPDNWRQIGSGRYSSVDSSSSDDTWSAFGTLQVAYDRLITDRILLGAFADFDFYNDNDLTLFDTDYYGDKLKGELNGKVDRDHMWTIGGRLGFLATPRILIYGLAGYSQMKLDGSLTASFADPYWNSPGWDTNNHHDLPLKVKESVDGWTVGAGLEAKIDRRLSLKFEYRYSHFDGASAKAEYDDHDVWFSKSKHYNKLYHQQIAEKGELDLGDTDVHSVRAVLSFKLGHDHEPVAPLK